MVAPQTVHLAADTKFGRDVVIEPYVVFGAGVTVEDGALIRSFSHLEAAHIGRGASVGPFARLRPGAKLGEKVRIGNFVEVKESTIGDRTADQSSHLHRRQPDRAGRQYRRRHHHLQLRRRRKAPHRDRRRRVRRLQLLAGRAAEDRRARLCRLGLGDHPRRAGGLAGHRPRRARRSRKAGRRGCASSRARGNRRLDTTGHELAQRMSNPILHWILVVAGGPLPLTSAKAPAATGCGC